MPTGADSTAGSIFIQRSEEAEVLLLEIGHMDAQSKDNPIVGVHTT
jgi:hypothetical protein